MKSQLLQMLIGLVLEMMSPETLKKFADIVLDFLEDFVSESEAEWDNKIVLPLCLKVREAFGIPDDD